MTINQGSLRNKGLEISLHGDIIRIKDSHLAEEYFLLSTPRFYELEMKLILFQIQNLQGYKELSVLFFLCHSMIF